MKNILMTAVLALMVLPVQAQYRTDRLIREGRYIYVTNPVGWGFNKLGIGAEYYKDRNGYMISVNKYLGFYPGMQVNGEYRYYTRVSRRSETYIYAKVTAGGVHYYNRGHKLWGGAIMDEPQQHTLGDDWQFNFEAPDYRSATYLYGGAGGGIGKRFNYRKLSIGLNAGVKYTPVFNGRAAASRDFKMFQVIGPGSLLDLNFTIGYKF